MNVYGGTQLAASFRQVRANTMQIAEEIPEEHYGFRAAADTRSIGQLLTHIALGPRVQLHIQGNQIDDVMKIDFPQLMQTLTHEQQQLRTKAETLAFLTSEGDRFASFVADLSEEFLSETVAMPPGATPSSKTRLEMLLSPKEHEMHHRGQLMLLERMIGITPHLTRASQAGMAAAAPAASQGPVQ
jgi:uncharacterized damage-inducible protein DinB